MQIDAHYLRSQVIKTYQSDVSYYIPISEWLITTPKVIAQNQSKYTKDGKQTLLRMVNF